MIQKTFAPAALVVCAFVVAACEPPAPPSHKLYSDELEGAEVSAGETPGREYFVRNYKSRRGPEQKERVDSEISKSSASDVAVYVDVSDQMMQVEIDGELAYQWPVSTAREGRYTPRGGFGVQVLSEFHKSSLYNNAPMPHSIFFDGNFAIHGTTNVEAIGTPASAGCVRLLPEDAEVLFDFVRRVGRSNVNIQIKD